MNQTINKELQYILDEYLDVNTNMETIEKQSEFERRLKYNISRFKKLRKRNKKINNLKVNKSIVNFSTVLHLAISENIDVLSKMLKGAKLNSLDDSSVVSEKIEVERLLFNSALYYLYEGGFVRE
ncbi:hypothetical protein [Brochothrix thermosphacta]|uniref:hypothetical protein n=1 Tax=Brochothrix thermosphacta TaxID=2756 RepID=UPI003F9D7EAD